LGVAIGSRGDMTALNIINNAVGIPTALLMGMPPDNG
jgi:hypothetical protein